MVPNGKVKTIQALCWCALLLLPAIGACEGTKVYVDPVESRPIQQWVWFPGTVTALEQAVVSSDGEGVLLELADVGRSVDKDGLIARLDDERYQLQFSEIDAQVDRLAIEVEFLQSEMERTTALATKNSISNSQLARSRADFAGRQFELESAIARRNRLNWQIEKARVLSPFAGIVTARLRQPGERVLAGDPLLSLVNPDRPIIEVNLPTRQIKHLKPGDTLPYQLEDFSGKGSVVAIVPQNVSYHQSRVRLEIDASTAQIAEPARVGFPSAETREGLVVKRDALIIRESGVYLYRVSPANVAQRLAVRVGFGQDEWVEVVNDELRAGDQIVIRGGERLKDGQSVRIEAPHTRLVVH